MTPRTAPLPLVERCADALKLALGFDDPQSTFFDKEELIAAVLAVAELLLAEPASPAMIADDDYPIADWSAMSAWPKPVPDPRDLKLWDVADLDAEIERRKVRPSVLADRNALDREMGT